MIRIKRPLLIPALVFLLAAALFVFLVWQKPELPLFLSPRRNASSWSVLEEIQKLQQLQTAAYELQMVFPFDLSVGQSVNWSALKRHYDKEPSLFLAKAKPGWHPGNILPPEWKYAELYALCRRVGLDPGRPDYRFIVLTARIEAGVNLDEWEKLLLNPESDKLRGIHSYTDKDAALTLEIAAPPVEVSTFTVHDQDSISASFPDVPLSPENWRLVIEAVKPQLIQMALDSGLIEKARQEAEDFLSEIFKTAGYVNIRFIQ